MESKPFLFALLFSGCACCAGVRADTVWNKQGLAIEGEIISDDSGQPIVFRCMHKGEWKTYVLGRDEIRKYTIVPGDQSDGRGDASESRASTKNDFPATGEVAGSGKPSTEKPPRGLYDCGELRPLIEDMLRDGRADGPEIVVLHLNGVFEPANIFRVGKAISAGVFDVLMDVAVARKPQAIVLRIDSGGGRIDQMDRIIERLLEVQGPEERQRVVAWVDLGGSAAALTALACKELVMMPQGRLGAATRTYMDGEAVEPPASAIEQKQEAMREARRRQIASLTERPLSIQDAMEKPEHQFWHHPVLGFSLDEQDDSEWEPYDTDEERPLVLEARAVVDLGIAVGIAKDVETLLPLLDLPAGTCVTDIDLASPAIQSRLTPAIEHAKAGNAAVEKFMVRVKKEIDDAQLAIRATAGIRTATQGYTAADLAVFRNALAKCQAPRIDAKTREFLKSSAPERLALYEDKLAMAQRVFDRARQSAADAGRSGGIAMGAIVADIEYAINNLVEIGMAGE
jgi:hypothetical protein